MILILGFTVGLEPNRSIDVESIIFE